MSKKKKHRSSPKNRPASYFYERQKQRQAILAKETPQEKRHRIITFIWTTLVMLAFAIVVWSLLGQHVATLAGFDSSDAVVKNTLLGIQNNDTSLLQKCICPEANQNDNMYTAFTEYAASVENNFDCQLTSVNTTYKSNDITTGPLTETIGFQPDNAVKTIASVELNQNRNTIDTNGICVYEIITFEHNQKWFIYSFSELGYEIVDMPVSQKANTYTVGTKDTGWLKIDDNWSETDAENSVFAAQETRYYENKEQTTSIMVSAISENISIDNAVAKATDILTSDPSTVSITQLPGKIGGIDCQRLLSTKTDEAGHTSRTYIWFFKNTIKSPYLYQIMMTTTDDYESYPVIMTYTL